MTLHQGAPREGHRMAPLEVTDAHGRRQTVKEIILDGSGVRRSIRLEGGFMLLTKLISVY